LKIRSERLALLLARPGLWTSPVVEAARLEANTCARPRRLHGATPDQAWHARPPLTAEDRAQFQATVARLRIEARQEKGIDLAAELSRVEQAKVDRVALRRALVAHDLLLFRRRTIPAPIERPKVTSRA